MRSNFDPLSLADLASGQWGMFTTAQAAAVGATPQRIARMANAGLLERLRHGVYRLTGTPHHQLDETRAAWLALDPSRPVADRLDDEHPGVVSHRTAASVHGLGDLDADDVDLTVATRRQSRVRGTRFHVEDLRRDQWIVLNGLPVTTIATTIGQLAGARTDGGHLAAVVRDAYVTGQIDPREISATLRPYAHLYGATLGNGEQLVDQFLEQAGVPDSTRRAAEGATTRRTNDLVAASLTHIPTLSAILNRTLADISGPLREQIAQIVKTQISNSAINESMAEIARAILANSSVNESMAEIARAVVNSATNGSLAGTARASLPAVDTSALANIREIAHTATDHVDRPTLDRINQAARQATKAAEAAGLFDRSPS